jgi:hypothetical protein
MLMRRRQLIAAALAMVALAGCGVTKKQAMDTRNDSLVAGNPLEPSPGNLTPQAGYAPGTVTPAPQARARSYAPARSRATTYRRARSSPVPSGGVSRLVPSGTPIRVRPTATVSSKTASVGEAWSGVVTSSVVVDGRTVIPAGAAVTGTVSEAVPAERGGRARLQLAMSSVSFDGHHYRVSGHSEEIVAGSTRTRNIGGIAAGTAAGALIGRAVGGSGKGALVGGLIGAAGSGAAVAASKGYQARVESDETVTIYAR